MTEENIRELLEKYRVGNCNEDEAALVEIWYEGLAEGNPRLNDEELDKGLKRLDARIEELIDDIPKRHKTPSFKRYSKWIAVAASLLLLSGIGLYYIWKPNQTAISDVAAPEGTHTRIELDNGEIINVDELALQDTVDAGQYRIIKHASGQLEYLPQKDAPVIYNTVKTGTGGFISIVLSDGTQVWLNANSSLTYPILFNEGFRDVSLTGEGYFEVAHRTEKGKPEHFFVKTAQHTVEVYGTKFIVDSDGQHFKTTLLEGKIGLAKIHSTLGAEISLEQPITLLPEQQYSADDGGTVTKLADAASELDWKEGYFQLTDKSFLELSKDLTDWYGLPFDLSSDITHPKFYGQISKKKSLKQVLDFMEEVSSLNFIIQKGRIRVEERK